MFLIRFSIHIIEIRHLLIYKFYLSFFITLLRFDYKEKYFSTINIKN